MGVFFLIIGGVILLINFAINSANIIKIVQYCFATNTLDQYWPAVFKSSFSGRAIISSLIGLALALVIFIIITPFVLVRQVLFEKKVKEIVSNGLYFEYPDRKLPKDTTFHTNIKDIGIEAEKEHPASGSIRIDAILAIAAMSKACEENNQKLTYEVMKDQKLNNGKTAKIPLLLDLEGKKYPTYFLYDQNQINQYDTITQTMKNNGFEKCLYFSTEKIF